MFKRLVCGILCLLVVVAMSLCGATESTFISDIVSATETKERFCIIIDAGHGGFDGGAVAHDGTVEKDLNLKIALKLDAVLRASGYKTILVRSDDSSTNDPTDGEKAKVSDIKNRAKLMSKYKNSIFVSIHMNKYSTTQPHGAQVFYAKTDGSKELALLLQASVASHVQTDNKRVIKPTTKDIYLLSHATVPAVIVECGFLSNQNDLESLKENDYQLKIATALAYGIINFRKKEVKIGES